MGFSIKGIFRQVPRYAKHLGTWAKANSNWLLAAFAALGVALTAEEAIRATIKAVKVCEEKQIRDGKEVVKTVWKLYIPMVGFFLLTTIAIGGNAHLNAKHAATAASLVALTQADAKAFKDKATEMLGERKVDKIEDEVERDSVEQNPPPSEDHIIKTGHGDHLFREKLTGQWLRACPEWIVSTEEKINRSQDNDMDGIVTASYYLDTLGADGDCYIGEAFWDKAEMLEKGEREIKLDITDCRWMEVNGKQEMVSTIVPRPYPSGI